MKERPILFSGPMVRAILEGRKTQTRRIYKGLPPKFYPSTAGGVWGIPIGERAKCPFGAPGDRLWVRETWARVHPGMLQSLDPDPDSHEWNTVYRADENSGYVGRMLECTKWRPSIHMPRWASRLTLEITAVRVERLQDITEEDAKAEGVAITEYYAMSRHPYRSAFIDLWDSIYGNWTANPYVWVVEFRKVEDKR